MIGVTLKHLRYMEALAEHRHFGRAADACAISQPALSMQIKELEEIVGAPLIERSARQIQLTRIGEDFVKRVRKILLAVDELADVARASAGSIFGRLRIGIIPTVAPYLLADIMTALHKNFPELELEVQETITKPLIDGLLQFRFDFAIVALPISEPALQEFALFDEEFVLVRPAGQNSDPVPSPQLLREMHLLLLEEGHCFRDQALSFCDLSPVRSQPIMEGSSLTTLVQMVGSGMGVTLIPEMAIGVESRFSEVSVARFPKPQPSRTIGMVWRKSNPLIQHFMDIGAVIRNVGQAKLAQHPWL